MENVEKSTKNGEVPAAAPSVDYSTQICDYIFAKKALDKLDDASFWENFTKEHPKCEVSAEKLKEQFFNDILPKIPEMYADAEETRKYFETLKTNNAAPEVEKKEDKAVAESEKSIAEKPFEEDEGLPDNLLGTPLKDEKEAAPGTPGKDLGLTPRKDEAGLVGTPQKVAGTPRKRVEAEAASAAPSPKRPLMESKADN